MAYFMIVAAVEYFLSSTFNTLKSSLVSAATMAALASGGLAAEKVMLLKFPVSRASFRNGHQKKELRDALFLLHLQSAPPSHAQNTPKERASCLCLPFLLPNLCPPPWQVHPGAGAEGGADGQGRLRRERRPHQRRVRHHQHSGIQRDGRPEEGARSRRTIHIQQGTLGLLSESLLGEAKTLFALIEVIMFFFFSYIHIQIEIRWW